MEEENGVWDKVVCRERDGIIIKMTPQDYSYYAKREEDIYMLFPLKGDSLKEFLMLRPPFEVYVYLIDDATKTSGITRSFYPIPSDLGYLSQYGLNTIVGSFACIKMVVPKNLENGIVLQFSTGINYKTPLLPFCFNYKNKTEKRGIYYTNTPVNTLDEIVTVVNGVSEECFEIAMSNSSPLTFPVYKFIYKEMNLNIPYPETQKIIDKYSYKIDKKE